MHSPNNPISSLLNDSHFDSHFDSACGVSESSATKRGGRSVTCWTFGIRQVKHGNLHMGPVVYEGQEVHPPGPGGPFTRARRSIPGPGGPSMVGMLVPLSSVGSVAYGGYPQTKASGYKWYFSCQWGDGLCHRSHRT